MRLYSSDYSLRNINNFLIFVEIYNNDFSKILVSIHQPNGLLHIRNPLNRACI